MATEHKLNDQARFARHASEAMGLCGVELLTKEPLQDCQASWWAVQL